MKTIMHLIVWDWKVLFKVRSFAFWTLVGPLIFMIAFGVMLRNNTSSQDRTLRVKIENLSSNHPLFKNLKNVDLSPSPNSKITLSFDPKNPYHVTIQGADDDQRELIRQRLIKAMLQTILKTNPAKDKWHLEVKPWKKRNPFPTGFAYSIPAYISMYIFFNLFGMLQAFWVQERMSSFYTRVLGSPIKPVTYFTGKLVSRSLVGMIIVATALGLGVVTKVKWGEGLGTVLFITLLYTIGSVSFGYILSFLWRNPDAASGFGIMISLISAALGGNWWPLEFVSPTMQKVGLLVPTGQMMDAFMRSFLDPDPSFTSNLVYMTAYAVLGLALTYLFLYRSIAPTRK